MNDKVNRNHITKNVDKERLHTIVRLVTPLVAVLFSILVGAIVIAMAGVNPIYAYGHLWNGAFGTVNNFSETLVKTTPMLIAGIGLAISFRANLINIGAEGQMIVGAIVATLVAFTLPNLPMPIAVALVMLSGFAGGALYGTFPGYLKAKFGTSEIITTIMLNYIAVSLLAFLLDGPMKEPNGYFPQTALVPANTELFRFVDGARLNVGFIIALLLIPAYYILMFRLPLGYKIRAVGLNPNAAKYAGIKVKRQIVLAMALSGGLAGIAGMIEIFGIHHRLYNGFTAGYGFDGVAIALIGGLHPIGVPLAALFFGALRVGANAMQNVVQIPVAVTYIIQGAAVLFILTDVMIRERFTQLIKNKGFDSGMAKQMEVE
jgi:general nucleoside transport system permease protein